MPNAIDLPLTTPELDEVVAGGARFRRSILPSGVRLLTEDVPGATSASIGYWVPLGSRDEAPHQYGSTHFLEHLLFKGTRTRTAYDLAIAFERVGGEHNAATSREHTLYHAKVRDADLPMAIDTLSDMITSSLIDRDEFETERGVILEELAMADDDPTDVLWERFFENAYGEHALARPIGGTPESIRATSRDAVWDYYRARYTPRDLVVTIAGRVDHDVVRERLEASLRAGGWDLDTPASPLERRSTAFAGIRPASPLAVVDRPLEQVNLIIGMPGLVMTDDRRSAFSVLHRAFGGGMSSRLFQEVREKRGLAYSVHSFGQSHSDLGTTGVYAGCAPQKTLEVVKVVRDEIAKLVESGIDETELADAKSAAVGSTALALEDSDTRMGRLGRAEISQGEFVDHEVGLARVEAVTLDDVHGVARDFFRAPWVSAAIGRVPDDAREALVA